MTVTLRTIATLALAVATTSITASAAAGTSARVCNGSTALCSRRLGDVVFATTHNSMASSADRFRPPNQRRPINEQLEHGIRGFQIDAYAGTERDGGVYTDVEGTFGNAKTDLSPSLVASAVRIHERLGAPPAGTPTQVYLCHTFCELGAIRMSKVAQQIEEFLDQNKREVIVIVIEDYVPPARIREVLRDAGLAPMLLEVEAGKPLPTLGAMLESGKRLLVTLENGDGGPTLRNAFAGLLEETPYSFLRASELSNAASCKPNRGVEDAPIFQFNHWVTPARATAGKVVNSASILGARVKRCTAVRGRKPTLVAVDFAESGDLLGVVHELNLAATPK